MKMFRAGLYARVSTNDQQTLAMQNRAMREYTARRGWTIALQVREVNSGAARREAREKLLDAARRREIDVVLVWRLDRWGRSVTDLLATLQELEHLGVGFVSLTEALDLTTPAGRAMAGWPSSRSSNARFCGSEPGPAWRMHGRTGNGWAGRRPRQSMRQKSGNCTAPGSASRRSPGGFRSVVPPYDASWRVIPLRNRPAQPSYAPLPKAHRSSPGRPPIAAETEALIVRFARENSGWGYDRIVGALANLGHSVSDQTVGNILRRYGIAPAPKRSQQTTWKDFIASHMAVLAGTDFFTVEVLTWRGLATYYVLFFIHLETRRVSLAGLDSTSHLRMDAPNGSQRNRREFRVPPWPSVPSS